MGNKFKPAAPSFPARLRTLREAARLSQAALSALANIGERTIRAYELGGIEPSLGAIDSIAKALGMSPGELISGK